MASTELRAAAKQALEFLDAEFGWSPGEAPRIDALRAALVEDALQRFTDVNQELEAALGCNHCNSPLYAAVKCRVCGRETPIIEPEIKDDNKPVAWMHVPYPGNAISPMLSLSKHREPSIYAASVPLYFKEQL